MQWYDQNHYNTRWNPEWNYKPLSLKKYHLTSFPLKNCSIGSLLRPQVILSPCQFGLLVVRYSVASSLYTYDYFFVSSLVSSLPTFTWSIARQNYHNSVDERTNANVCNWLARWTLHQKKKSELCGTLKSNSRKCSLRSKIWTKKPFFLELFFKWTFACTQSQLRGYELGRFSLIPFISLSFFSF